ncbi:MAG: lactoylglutathione lyase [Hydrotalea sp.]|nr:lactoylglutathione lyase [Hydrotalea sp.]
MINDVPLDYFPPDYTRVAKKPRLLHTMMRVIDLEQSLNFYVGLLGMRLLRRDDYPDGRFSLAFVGYEDEKHGAVIELTHNWDRTEPYVVGDAFGHIAIRCDNLRKFCDFLKLKNVTIPRPPGPMGGKPGAPMLAFIKDPDGHLIELLPRD